MSWLPGECNESLHLRLERSKPTPGDLVKSSCVSVAEATAFLIPRRWRRPGAEWPRRPGNWPTTCRKHKVSMRSTNTTRNSSKKSWRRSPGLRSKKVPGDAQGRVGGLSEIWRPRGGRVRVGTGEGEEGRLCTGERFGSTFIPSRAVSAPPGGLL